ncbi:hypothetical protein HPP92_016780 [Vanilla planifolia]|uniref:F-box domain-containing protein n=1 Tax=Vanilla planifolia TaxID=51239 RepID=A0A835QGS3_VANPL|nr:hypothetical protein HPP92_016780 [Vanilla planifolia]
MPTHYDSMLTQVGLCQHATAAHPRRPTLARAYQELRHTHALVRMRPSGSSKSSRLLKSLSWLKNDLGKYHWNGTQQLLIGRCLEGANRILEPIQKLYWEERCAMDVSKIPDHLLVEIFVRLPISEWAQISCVSKLWASIFRGECLWQTAIARTWPTATLKKRWPGPIPRGLARRRYMALYVSQQFIAIDNEVDELAGHAYLFLKEQLEHSTMPPTSSILHGTIIDQFISCGRPRDKAHELASHIWLAVINNLEENEHTFTLLKRLALEGDMGYSV